MNSSKAILRGQLAHVVLALLLLCGQHYATRHWLAHAIESTHAKHPGLPERGHCLVCDGLVTFGAALPTNVFALPEMPPQGLANSPDLNLSVVIIGIATGYHSRAPPAVA